jgi:eukaryotic-like serine/threonine-protein kinase
MIGSTLSHFRITAQLGAGGMGEVYRAEDSALGREVAIKVLPAAFTADPERLARFEREARTLASLSHPNIAAIHEVGREDGTHFLVMELARGETLAERLARGPIPVGEALPIALQIAEALEAAHERGIVHRDLKPANVMVDAEGRVKVLDFGLAKALGADGEGGAPDLAHSPTLTYQATRAGVLLGTAAYMSPEQAKGRPADKRSDIWAFGIVLWEMLTGKPLFPGETLPEVLAAVLGRDIDLGALPGDVPRPIRRALLGCLARDPQGRWRSAGDVALLLQAGELPVAPPSWWARHERRVLLAAAPTAALAAGLAVWLASGVTTPADPASEQVRKLEVARGASRRAGGRAAAPVISPDGRWVAFQRQRGLWLRPLDAVEERPVPDSDESSVAIWSPDSRWIAFQAGGRLLKVPVEGGRSQLIANLPHNGDGPSAGGSWGDDEQIVFTTGYSGLLMVPARGGEVTTLLAPTAEESDYHNAHLLPGGAGVVFAVHLRGRAETPLAIYRDGQKQILHGLPDGQLGYPAYDPKGFLLFERGPRSAGVWAAPFSLDDQRVTGDPFLVAAGGEKPSVDRSGNLLYQEARPHRAELVWVDREGRLLETLGEPMVWLNAPHLAPDGKRIAFVATDSQGTDIFVRNLERGTTSRLTFTPDLEFSIRWSPGGDRVAFDTEGAEHMLHVLEVDTGRPPVTIGAGARPVWTPSGALLYEVFGARGIWTATPEATGEGWRTAQVLDDPSDESAPTLSPDGRFMAFLADPSGRQEVYVTRFPSAEGRRQVSRGASFVNPVWSRRGDEIFYVDDRGMMVAVPVQTAPELVRGAPQTLFEPPAWEEAYWIFDVDREGRRFLLTRPLSEEPRHARLIHVQGWLREFQTRR